MLGGKSNSDPPQVHVPLSTRLRVILGFLPHRIECGPAATFAAQMILGNFRAAARQ